MSLEERLKRQGASSVKKRVGPLWEGPSSNGDNGGVTYSMLSRFLVCRERFRLYAIEGLRTMDSFNHRIEYGQMWHLCEECHARGEGFKSDLYAYAKKLCQRYPTQQEDVQHWYEVCCVQFPIYLKYWEKQDEKTGTSSEKGRTPLLQEQVFDVPYTTPSGRTVRLRGKWDGVDLIGKGKGAGVYLMEHKTKGDIDEQQIVRQLSFDLQTMMYLVALTETEKGECQGMPGFGHKFSGLTNPPSCDSCGLPMILGKQIKGVRYNVVRRPLSGGKGTIRQKQGESKQEYYARLAQYIADEPHTYFMRWKCEVIPDDITRFRHECLNPILEQLCDWWEWMTTAQDPFSVSCLSKEGHMLMGCHYRFPYGIFSPLTEGIVGDLDNYLATRSEVGLTRAERLFEELR